MKTSKGTLTRFGWAWKCTKCGLTTSLLSDNFVLEKCSDCGEQLVDLPEDEVEQYEKEATLCSTEESDVKF